MNMACVELTLFIFFFMSGVLHAGTIVPKTAPAVRRLVIDTDAGGDDGVAISLALGAEKLWGNVSVVSLTAVNGNTNADNVARNLLKILKTADRLDVPVFKGVNESLLCTPPSDNYYGQDGFGDFPFPNPPGDDLIQETHAVIHLVNVAKENPGEITLVCIGPLTNIALATRLDPEFLTRLADVIILGGSVKGEGNVRPGIEFNVYVDPEAAAIVFNAGIARVEKGLSPIKLVSWETTLQTNVTVDWRKNVLGTLGSPVVELLNKAEAVTLNGEQWIFADSIAMAIAINEQFPVTKLDENINVETAGAKSRGALFVDYSNASNETKQIELQGNVDSSYMKRLFLTLLNYP